MKNYLQYIFAFMLISSISFAQSELLEFQVRDKNAVAGEIKAAPPEAMTGIIKWEEIFDSATPPAGWTVIDNDGSGTQLDYVDQVTFVSGDTINPAVGNYYWYSNFNNANSSGVIDEWLISPMLPEIEAGDKLNFYAGAIGGIYKDSIKVLVSTTDANPGSFTEIAYFEVDGPVASWNKYSFDLTAFAGSQIYVAVNYYIFDGGPVGTHSDNVWIDHFTITSPGARLQVIHNAADVAADPVVVYLNGDVLLPSFAFRDATPFIDAPAGVPLNIGIGLPGGTVNDTLKNFSVTLADGETYIAFANGVTAPGSYAANPDGRSTTFDLLVKPMAREMGTSSDVDFFVLHGATDAPTVDVIARGVATLVNDAAYGDITPYINVPAASYVLDLTLADGTTLVQSYEADLSTLGGGSAAVFASGFLTPSANQNGEAFGIFFALADGTVGQFPVYNPTARLQVIHNAADVAADPVVVYLNGDVLLPSFSFREATPFIDAPAETPINIGIGLPGGTVNDTLKNFNVTLADGETYIAIANGVVDTGLYAANPDGRNTNFGLFIKPMAREMGTSSDVDFFVLHGATDAPTVDVIARGVATLVNDAAYGDITPYISVPAGAYTLDLTLADGTTLVQSYIADLSTLGGGSAAVFASGFLTPSSNQDGAPFGIFFALADGTVGEFPSGVVPVELTSFTASVNGSAVSLKWSTATETNNRGFEVERKFDKGENTSEWQTIGFVSGKGTTSERTDYIYEDDVKEIIADRYVYRLKQVDFDGTFDYSNEVEVTNVAPTAFSLDQNYPNPFNPSTTIKFSLPQAEVVSLKIYNILGSEVATLLNGTVEAGSYDVNFDASNLSSGVYLYELRAGNFTKIMKMNLIK
jgi:type IX secretion system substrate protein/uncharacterized protein DUF4397/cleaved adhesin domain-containing protein